MEEHTHTDELVNEVEVLNGRAFNKYWIYYIIAPLLNATDFDTLQKVIPVTKNKLESLGTQPIITFTNGDFRPGIGNLNLNYVPLHTTVDINSTLSPYSLSFKTWSLNQQFGINTQLQVYNKLKIGDRHSVFLNTLLTPNKFYSFSLRSKFPLVFDPRHSCNSKLQISNKEVLQSSHFVHNSSLNLFTKLKLLSSTYGATYSGHSKCCFTIGIQAALRNVYNVFPTASDYIKLRSGHHPKLSIYQNFIYKSKNFKSKLNFECGTNFKSQFSRFTAYTKYTTKIDQIQTNFSFSNQTGMIFSKSPCFIDNFYFKDHEIQGPKFGNDVIGGQFMYDSTLKFKKLIGNSPFNASCDFKLCNLKTDNKAGGWDNLISLFKAAPLRTVAVGVDFRSKNDNAVWSFKYNLPLNGRCGGFITSIELKYA